MNVNVTNSPSRGNLAQKEFGILLFGVILLAAVFFLTAGTLRYWEAWLYLGVIFIPGTLFLVYLLRNAPDLLARRLRTLEKEKIQSRVVRLTGMIMLLAFVIPGLDRRFGWSSVPPWVVIAANLVALAGYGLYVIVLRENRYASRIIEVEQHQQVISTGPYAVVRHPLYVAVLLMYMFSPLALGSYWAVLPTLLMPIFLVIRINNEEAMLSRDLEGYQAYVQRVRYRLIPGVW